MTERVLTQVEAPDFGFLRRLPTVGPKDLPRLDGASGKKQVWRPHVRTQGRLGVIYCTEEKTYTTVGIFWRPSY